MIRLLILIFLLVPQISWGKSSLPPCPETGVRHNCFGSEAYPSGAKYVGEFRDGKRYGFGTFTTYRERFVGEYRDGKRHGQGIEYLDGSVAKSGQWADGILIQSYALDPTHFPFNPTRACPEFCVRGIT